MKRLVRRPSPATAVAVLALLVTLSGTSYAAATLAANSVGPEQIQASAVTLPKIRASAQTALRGPAGKPCQPSDPGCRGPAGASPLEMFVDSSQQFENKVLGVIGPWTIKANCIESSTGATDFAVYAYGPAETIGDGEEDGHPYSRSGDAVDLGGFYINSGYATHTAEITLDSATQGSAHFSVFVYAQSPSSSFRCKANVTGYSGS